MKEKLWTPNFIWALVVMFGIYMVSSILLSLMAIFAKEITNQDTYAGMMTSVFTLGALSVRFLAGKLIEYFSSKKVVLTGIALMIIGSLFFIDCQYITLALIGRVLQGIGFGMSATATNTYIATMCHPTRLLEGISFTSVAMSLTAVLGPAIGFQIVGVNFNRFNWLFIITIGIGLITFFIMTFERPVHVESTDVKFISHNAKAVLWRPLILPVMILFMNALTQSSIVSFLALFAISLNFVGIGSFFSINAVGMITSRFIMNKLVERYGKFTMILVNTFVFSVSVFLLTQVRSMLHMLLLAFPAGFTMGSIAPIINTYLIQKMPQNKKGLANAVYFSALDIGFGLGSLGWGIIAMNVDYGMIFYLAALIQLVAVILSYIQIKVYSHNELLSAKKGWV